jgi:hypothetical protein
VGHRKNNMFKKHASGELFARLIFFSYLGHINLNLGKLTTNPPVENIIFSLIDM